MAINDKPSAVVSFNAVPEDAADPDVKVYVNGELVESGGGGSGDLSIATVTIGADSDTGTLGGSFVYKKEYEIYENDGSAGYIDAAAEQEYEIILYKGVAYVDLGESEYTSLSGDVTYDADNNVLVVTGDCSITLSTNLG